MTDTPPNAPIAAVSATASEAVQCKPLEVLVSDRGIERAIKMLKRKLASEGVLRELKMRRHYMKPSVKKRKKQNEAAKRRSKRAKRDREPMPAAGAAGAAGPGGPGGPMDRPQRY